MLSNVGCQLAFDVSSPVSIVVQVAAARRPFEESLRVVGNGVPLPTREISQPYGGRQHLVEAEPGVLTVDYRAQVTSPVVTPQRTDDAERILALRPSRYCPSDRMAGFAHSHFGDLPTALDRVRAICEYVWEHVSYETETSGSTTDAVDTLLAARGVCRDFAHVVVALCRAVDVPARVAAVYAPGLSPMDFHLVVETEIDGEWRVWDPTRLAPRPTLVRVATGRDAADVAFATVVSGRAELTVMELFAVAGSDLPLDDHNGLVTLPS